MNAATPAVEYREVTVTAPSGAVILDRVSLSVARGERAAFLGRSGAGKTTALKLVNGLVAASGGEMLVDGARVAGDALVALRRRTGYVMQQPALFPHRTVFDNVATVPRLLGWPEERVAGEAGALMQRMDLPLAEFGARHPRMLSGGQQQRVAIARALVAAPDLFLCDEPFSALDPLIRAELQSLLRSIAAERPATTLLFVTHDVREALRVADRIVLFDAGRVVADAPAARFAAHEHPLARRFLEAAGLGASR